MFIMRFTERAYVHYTEQDVRSSFRAATRLTFPNTFFDPRVGAEQYNEYLDEFEYCDRIGFDGLMLNEHHNTPTCLGAAMNLEAAILARTTRNAKIVLLGNPLPIHENPLRLAEELAEIDLISRGRLVSGFVRGTGVETWATNTNPVYNRERFEEAHDLIIKAWTTPGPFRWEGRHYQFRVVNPFQRPLQEPHPPVWVPGVTSPETLVWAAERHYPYIYLETDPLVTQDLMGLYKKAAQEVGYEPGPQNFGYLVRVQVQDTDEKAFEIGKGFLVGNAGVGRVPMPAEFMAPAGYNSREARQSVTNRYRHAVRPDPLYGGLDAAGWDKVVESNRVIVGNPETVIRKLRRVLSELRPGILGIWSNDGTIGHADSMRCLELLGQEVLPALREMARELDLPGPFEQAP
jgi:alkanesulfonate monooxygenase SsuD/methylene tetrahydromethanopterin reductase-like flavin-dependent oxidoreductase (luciferase family)